MGVWVWVWVCSAGDVQGCRSAGMSSAGMSKCRDVHWSSADAVVCVYRLGGGGGGGGGGGERERERDVQHTDVLFGGVL